MVNTLHIGCLVVCLSAGSLNIAICVLLCLCFANNLIRIFCEQSNAMRRAYKMRISILLRRDNKYLSLSKTRYNTWKQRVACVVYITFVYMRDTNKKREMYVYLTVYTNTLGVDAGVDFVIHYTTSFSFYCIKWKF